MKQIYQIEFFRIGINFNLNLIDRLVEYCDDRIIKNIVECDVIFDLSLVKNKNIQFIDDVCRDNYGFIKDDLPSKVVISYVGKIINNSRVGLMEIKDYCYKLYNFIPVLEDGKRFIFQNIAQSIEDLEYSGTEIEIRNWLDKELSVYSEYEKFIPI